MSKADEDVTYDQIRVRHTEVRIDDDRQKIETRVDPPDLYRSLKRTIPKQLDTRRCC